MTTDMVARRLGITKGRLRYEVTQGRIAVDHYGDNGRMYFSPEEVERAKQRTRLQQPLGQRRIGDAR